MYLGKQIVPEFQIFGIDPNFSCLPKVLIGIFGQSWSQILVLYNLGKNICFVYLYYLCINTSNFCHGATFFFVFASFHRYSTMIEYLYTKFK
jgi:hypothetical protein